MELIKKLRSKFSMTGLIILQMILLIGTIVGANFAAMHAQFGWDMSEEKVHSLDPETLGILAKVKKPIHVMIFAKRFSESGYNLLDNFTKACRGMTYELVDPAEDIDLAKKYDVADQKDGVVIVESGERRQRLPRLREQALLNAVIQLTRDSDKKILFTTGHGEKDALNNNPEGILKANGLLTDAGYTTSQAELTEAALADAKVVILAGPIQEYDDAAAARLEAFVKAGGGLLILADPRPGATLANIMKPFNVLPADDFVIELDEGFRAPGYGPTTIYERHYRAEHPIGKRMSGPISLRGVRSLEYINWPEKDAKLEDPWALCISSKKSWGETNFTSKQVTPDRDDHGGPRILIFATGDESSVAGKGRVMIVGTSAPLTNRDFGSANNREFFELAVTWLANDMDLPMITEKTIERKLDLTDNQKHKIAVTCVLAIPALTALMGLIAFVRRAR